MNGLVDGIRKGEIPPADADAAGVNEFEESCSGFGEKLGQSGM